MTVDVALLDVLTGKAQINLTDRIILVQDSTTSLISASDLKDYVHQAPTVEELQDVYDNLTTVSTLDTSARFLFMANGELQDVSLSNINKYVDTAISQSKYNTFTGTLETDVAVTGTQKVLLTSGDVSGIKTVDDLKAYILANTTSYSLAALTETIDNLSVSTTTASSFVVVERDGSLEKISYDVFTSGLGQNSEVSLDAVYTALASTDGIAGSAVGNSDFIGIGDVTEGTLRSISLPELSEYINPTLDTTNITTTGLEVVSGISTNSTGHITAMSKRTLSVEDFGGAGLDSDNTFEGVNAFNEDVSFEGDVNFSSGTVTFNTSVVCEENIYGTGIESVGDCRLMADTDQSNAESYAYVSSGVNEITVSGGNTQDNSAMKFNGNTVYHAGNLTYGTGDAPLNMAVGDIYVELEE